MNINGEGVITGKREHKGRSVVDEYARTPVFPMDVVPRGRQMHVGLGVWVNRCSACDDYTLNYGSRGYDYDLAVHEAAHGLDVPGYNVPLMA